MKTTHVLRASLLALLSLLAALLVPLAAPAEAVSPAADPAPALPDPTARGSYTPAVVQEAKLGTAALQEPNSSGSAPTAGTAQAAENLEIRGQLYYPADRAEPSPLLVLVHGNHGSCDAGQDSTTATCTQYKRNEAGYAYLAENLATWGYTTFSLSQDQLMMRQDNNKGKGMHQRRKLIAAALDALIAANKPGGLPVDEHTTIGTTLVGRLDLTRIGLMGHSRGGDAVTSFIDYNRERTDGPRYPLRGVISLAPVDYERKAPYGMPYMTILPFCDGDVSNLQGARFFERSQYVNGDDPFPRIQSSQLGAIHNWYNTVWYADGGADGQANNDAACGNSAPFATNNVHPHNLRLSGAGSYTDDAQNYKIDNSATYDPAVNTKISGDAARMGDQERIGLATMAAFFRRYVGGEGAFEPYMTGELSDTASHLQIPQSACPTSTSGARIACKERVSTSYFAAPGERVDIIRPETENPLGLDALGGELSGSGFAYPYLDNGAVALPAKTPGGYDWCNPEPDDFAPAQLGKGTQPTAAKACPLPGKAALGGQNGTRENAPVNHSYGRQLALAWESGQKAELTADIPAASRDMSGLKALALGADVNFFDLRNPGADNRGDSTKTGTTADPVWPNELPQSYDPESSTQDFLIELTDTAGHTGTVHAGDERWGNALHASTGTNTPNTHIVLDQIRVPLSEFAGQGVDISSLDRLSFKFGEAGTPQSGSIQVADVRFQEKAAAGALVLSDGDEADGAGHGPPATGPDPADYLNGYDVTAGNMKLIDQVANPKAATTWVVDDDKAQCPTASFTSIQDAVDQAAPWDTVVVCDGVYQESSTPVFGPGNPVATDAMNGLTITKPLKIKGAGADKVTIEPKQSLGSLAGLKPYLRDGGGNVVTVSRQSLGSTDTNEMFVDISGVTVTSGDVWAEAGIAFFGASGRVSESVVGPMRSATTPAELADNPHGWGIVKTGVVLGAGKGTVDNEVTVAKSLVTGYQSGGILFDGARGADGAADNTVRTGIKNHGYVTGTVVRGKPNSVVPQTGVKFTSGADGFVRNSRITGNFFKPDPSKSFGILLTDAGTETAGALTASGDIVTGNGFAAYNANADGTAVRQGAPFALTGSFLGQGNPVAGGPADPSNGLEAISGPDTTPAATVTTNGRLSTPPSAVPTKQGSVGDDDPTAALVDPGQGTTVKVGQTVFPLVLGHDDFAVRSAALYVDGEKVATADGAPYRFSWTPGAAYAGKDVTFSAVVTDSAGNTTTAGSLAVAVAKVPVTPTLKVLSLVRNTQAGTATLTLAVNTPGRVTLTGGKVARVVRSTGGAATVTVLLRAKAPYGKVLARRGKLVSSYAVTFQPDVGGTLITKGTVTLVKKKRR
ncbi:Ig-like domain-containing protein [Marmoricola sp. RAF53]|uniref:Ig-like domain-containing protein n=1 Tax=Marmoricola sp. RAF53 TaxID=3233059 RepID=UPI003F990137